MSKMKASGGIALVLILVFIGFVAWSFYDVFFLDDPSPFSYILLLVLALIIIFVIGVAILDKLSEIFPKSKFLKTFKKFYEDTTKSIIGALSYI